MKYAEYIKQIEIDSLWSGKKHIVWNLDRQVNILSGVNGVGKSTILNKVVKGLTAGGEFPSHMLKGVHITVVPEEARWIRYDVIRSFDRPLLNMDTISKMNVSLATELDFQLFQLQRKYLDYQVNIGNRIIAALQSGEPDAAQKAQELSAPKKRFQDLIDDLFSETGKKIVRTENEIRFSQIGETLVPYQLSSGEKQMLAILLTVLVEDNLPYVLFMDEPEVSLHVEWQERLIELILSLNPNVQIILTTHSPALVMNGWMDRVTEVSLRLQAVGKVLRVVARHTDTGAHRRCGGIQHQNAAARHGTCRHCFHCPLHRAGDGQLHAQRPAVGLQKPSRFSGAQRTLRRHGADKTAVLPCAGKYGVQRLFQPGSAMTRAIQIAQQMLTQRHCGIPPSGGITGQPKASGVATYLQQKGCRTAAAAVQKRLPGGIGAGIQAVVIALPGKAYHLPALLETSEQPPLRIVKVAPPGGQLQSDRALRCRPRSIGRVLRQQIQPA